MSSWRCWTNLQTQFGVTIIIATHDEDVAAHTRRRIRIRDGSITSDTSNSRLTRRRESSSSEPFAAIPIGFAVMATVVVLVLVVGVLGFVFYWSGRHGDPKRNSGTSLHRGASAHTTRNGRPKKAYATSRRGPSRKPDDAAA